MKKPGNPADAPTALRKDSPWGDLDNLVYKPEVTLVWRDRDGRHEKTIRVETVIGSSLAGDVCISDATVSRAHLALEPRPNGVRVRDLGSANGSYVKDVRGEPMQIEGGVIVRDGTELLVGSTTLRIRHALESKPTKLPAATSFHGLIGQSIAMRELFADVELFAATDSTVLIVGETGTGKERFAQAIHDSSRRAGRKMVVLDCGAVPANLFDAQLFGHTKGAFTGADRDYLGKFLEAGGGTLFLDEIGELALDMQTRVLRMLETKSVCRLGESDHRTEDVRFIAATHRDLPAMVAVGSFREDLYHRLKVLQMRVPPLRARIEDLPLMLRHMLLAAGKNPAIDPGLLERLTKRQWPGNVRELRNFVEVLGAVGAERAEKQLEERPPSNTGMPRAATLTSLDDVAPPDVFMRGPLETARKAIERWLLVHLIPAVLERHGGNIKAAAEELGCDFRHVYKLQKQLGL